MLRKSGQNLYICLFDDFYLSNSEELICKLVLKVLNSEAIKVWVQTRP